MTSQKEVFLASEGDQWFRRNESALGAIDWLQDPVCKKIFALECSKKLSLLEVGCGDGSRISCIAKQRGWDVFGIDPSQEAINKAISKGVNAAKSTADSLPFPDKKFDVVVFGFCLYLCDDNDLFKIAAEADRVMADSGWLLILDFDSQAPVYRDYHHLTGIKSRKMDYKNMFLWHPSYTLAEYQKFHHSDHSWTDDANHWVSVATLRKCSGK